MVNKYRRSTDKIDYCSRKALVLNHFTRAEESEEGVEVTLLQRYSMLSRLYYTKLRYCLFVGGFVITAGLSGLVVYTQFNLFFSKNFSAVFRDYMTTSEHYWTYIVGGG